jgi:hypothetical protein
MTYQVTPVVASRIFSWPTLGSRTVETRSHDRRRRVGAKTESIMTQNVYEWHYFCPLRLSLAIESDRKLKVPSKSGWRVICDFHRARFRMNLFCELSSSNGHH